MKRITIPVILICIIFNVCVNVSAIAPSHVNNVTILGEEIIVMQVGETITLEAVADSYGFYMAYMYWNTDDADIVNLVGDNGTTENTSLISTATVTALNPGKAVISVYSDMGVVVEPEDYYENDSVIINVVPAEDSFVSKVKPEFVWYDMCVGDELNIKATAHTVGVDFAYFRWVVDNEAIIKVTGTNEAMPLSPSKSTVTIKALSSGTTTVYVYADCSYPQTYKAVYSKIIINVDADNYSDSVLPEMRYLSIKSDSEKTIFVGEEISLAAIAEQDDYQREWAYFTWSSNDENVATVVGDNGTLIRTPPISIGKIKGVSEGTAIITVFASATESETPIQDSVTINVIPKENTSFRKFLTASYNNDNEIADQLSCVIESLNDDIVLDMDNMSMAPEQSLYDSEYDLLVLLDLKATDENTPYPQIEETAVNLGVPILGGGASPHLGKNYKAFFMADENKEEISVTEIDDCNISFNISKLGKYVIYFDEYDEYVVNFYNEIPSENNEESDYIYHKIENLQANDIVVFPEIPEKENYVFTGWKVQSGSGIHFAEPQPFTALNNNGKYYASWCLEEDYEPIKLEISSNETITKGKENGKKITLKTNYGIFAEDTEFPAEWRTAYDLETNEQTKADILTEWKSKWNIVGTDDLLIENATRIDDKTIEFVLSGNSNDKYSNADIYIEFDSSLLLPEPYELNGEVINWDDTKIKMDADGVRAKMYCTDNAVTLSKQNRPSSGGGGGITRYTVTFDTNGGNNISKQTVNRNATVKEPEQPQKEEYNFVGWYTDKELTTAYDFETKVTKGFTLYAKWADIKKSQIILTIGVKEALVFGEEKENDVSPKTINNRTMLPIRFIAENLGAEVEWNGLEQKVTIVNDDIEIIITIDSDKAVVNGKTVTLDSPAFIESDRTYLPLRFISENLGAEVEWNGETQEVTITK